MNDVWLGLGCTPPFPSLTHRLYSDLLGSQYDIHPRSLIAMRATAWTFAGAMVMQFLAGCVAPGSVAAAEYSAEPIRFIVGYPAGGTTDIAARLIVDKMAASTGRRLIVDNRAGASGIIGAGVVANAAPDAHLLLFAASPEVALARALNRKMEYDPQTGLRPITLVGRVS